MGKYVYSIWPASTLRSDPPLPSGPWTATALPFTKAGVKKGKPWIWSQCVCPSRMLATTGCSARLRSDAARPCTPVPQSRMRRAPLAVVTSTHEVLPPKWTVPGPGVAIEPLVPQKRTLMASPGRRASGARLALRVDSHGAARVAGHLHAMFAAVEVIGHVPVGGCLAGLARASLHVLGRAIAGRAVVAPDV